MAGAGSRPRPYSLGFALEEIPLRCRACTTRSSAKAHPPNSSVLSIDGMVGLGVVECAQDALTNEDAFVNRPAFRCPGCGGQAPFSLAFAAIDVGTIVRPCASPVPPGTTDIDHDALMRSPIERASKAGLGRMPLAKVMAAPRTKRVRGQVSLRSNRRQLPVVGSRSPHTPTPDVSLTLQGVVRRLDPLFRAVDEGGNQSGAHRSAAAGKIAARVELEYPVCCVHLRLQQQRALAEQQARRRRLLEDSECFWDAFSWSSPLASRQRTTKFVTTTGVAETAHSATFMPRSVHCCSVRRRRMDRFLRKDAAPDDVSARKRKRRRIRRT